MLHVIATDPELEALRSLQGATSVGASALPGGAAPSRPASSVAASAAVAAAHATAVVARRSTGDPSAVAAAAKQTLLNITNTPAAAAAPVISLTAQASSGFVGGGQAISSLGSPKSNATPSVLPNPAAAAIAAVPPGSTALPVGSRLAALQARQQQQQQQQQLQQRAAETPVAAAPAPMYYGKNPVFGQVSCVPPDRLCPGHLP